jgi:hypothetical protein
MKGAGMSEQTTGIYLRPARDTAPGWVGFRVAQDEPRIVEITIPVDGTEFVALLDAEQAHYLGDTLARLSGHYKAEPEPMATPREVAKVLKVQVQTLSQWRYLGKGPAFHKAGHLVRYDWADVRDYQVAQRKQGAAA